MAFISAISETVSYFVGSNLDAISSETKRWYTLAGLVGGWAVGFFYAARCAVPKPQAIVLMAICSYAMARLGTDINSLVNMLALWLLEHGGERGEKYLLEYKVEVV